ncbi:hypothetical protein IU450_35435 [Nocardia abscessus]|nr:hypothetical protein [Nocardia abscessus]MBF6341141.1 hypothetical protein [Nocardia abscessus]
MVTDIEEGISTVGGISHPFEEETWMIALHDFDPRTRLIGPAATEVRVA